MRLTTILTELFDSKPFPFKYTGTVNDTKHTYEFTSPNSGILYDAFIHTYYEDGLVADVNFSVGGSTAEITMANEIQPILATMAKIVEDHYENRGGKDDVTVYIYMGSSKGKERLGSGSTSRQRIYDAFLRKVLPSDWTVKYKGYETYIYPPPMGKRR